MPIRENPINTILGPKVQTPNPIDVILNKPTQQQKNPVSTILTSPREEELPQDKPRSFMGGMINFFTPDIIKTNRAIRELKGAKDKGIKAEELVEEHLKGTIEAVDYPIQVAHGILGGRIFNADQLLTADWTPTYPGKEKVKYALEPKSAGSDVVYRLASLYGMTRAITKMSQLAPFRALAKWQPTKSVTVLAQNMINSGFKLGTYSILSEQGGKNLVENLKQRGVSGLHGAAIGAFFGAVHNINGGLVQKGAGKFNLAIQNLPAHITSFVMRLGLNQMVTGVPAVKRYLRGEEHLPGAIYSVGLGTWFSLASNSLAVTRDFNRAVQRQNNLRNMSQRALADKVESLGEFRLVPNDIKWAYIIKGTDGKVKPNMKNAPATDGIFEDVLRTRNPGVYNKLDFVRDIADTTAEVMNRYAEIQPKSEGVRQPEKPPEPVTAKAKVQTPAPVVEAKGEGIDVAHWSPKTDIKQFTLNKISNDLGVHFGTTKAAEERSLKGGKKRQGKIYPMMLAPNKILKMPDVRAWDNPQAVLEGLDVSGALSTKEIETLKYSIPNSKDAKYTSKVQTKTRIVMKKLTPTGKPVEVDEPYKVGGKFKSNLFFADQNKWYKNVRQILIDKGYDVISYKNIDEDVGSDSYIALKDDVMKKTVQPTQKQVEVPPVPIGKAVTTPQPPEITKQEDDMRIEMASDKDASSVKRMARRVGLLYKSKNNKQLKVHLNRFFMEYFNVPFKDIKKLTKEQITEAKEYMKKLVPDASGRIHIPREKELLPMDIFNWSVESLNPFDWLQTARMPLRPIYDIIKPAYINYLKGREFKIKQIKAIYNGKIKEGSQIDRLLAMYADGKISLDQIPKEYQDIAIERQKFYDTYADELIKRGLLSPKKVFNKDGTRRKYYHRIFDDVVIDMFGAGFGLEEMWLPGELPKAGPLRVRKGAQDYKFSALESDAKYIAAVEKYLNMKEANDVAITYAELLKGNRYKMANTFIRYMRGQPSNTDVFIKESLQSIAKHTSLLLKGAGLHGAAQRLRAWRAPSYPIARVASPIARFYYWRYVGLALDTSFKNSLQWQHAMARYGPKNIAKAMYSQYTPEAQALIKDSGILEEGIRRGGHFISESASTRTFNKLEEASYVMWNVTDIFNRQVSGLAAYYLAREQGATHPTALDAMRAASHETQYGYTKADSLLVDMATPLSRFILFKKWPMAKVEMVRQWIRDGHQEAVLHLALQEYMIYRSAQQLGIDLGPLFSSVWNLATRGIDEPSKLVPLADELVTAYKAFQTGPDGDTARDKLIKAWQGLGNRYVGKIIEGIKAWENNWQVRDYKGELKYNTSPHEQAVRLFSVPLESTKRRRDVEHMSTIKNEVQAYKEKAVRQALAGDDKGMLKTTQEMLDKYGDEFAEYYGKELTPINISDVENYAIRKELPVEERVRRTLPGKGIKIPKEAEFPRKEKAPASLVEKVRGY